MKGQILNYSVQTNSGIISGDDNQRYSFNGADWMESAPPRRGMQVDFAIIGTSATEVYAAPGVTSSHSPAYRGQPLAPGLKDKTARWFTGNFPRLARYP